LRHGCRLIHGQGDGWRERSFPHHQQRRNIESQLRPSLFDPRRLLLFLLRVFREGRILLISVCRSLLFTRFGLRFPVHSVVRCSGRSHCDAQCYDATVKVCTERELQEMKDMHWGSVSDSANRNNNLNESSKYPRCSARQRVAKFSPSAPGRGIDVMA
jgi:hypothetical protein